jgi:hypothetical protein
VDVFIGMMMMVVVRMIHNDENDGMIKILLMVIRNVDDE